MGNSAQGTSNSVCSESSGDKTHVFDLSGCMGRYVTLNIPGRLTLCEMEIYHDLGM